MIKELKIMRGPNMWSGEHHKLIAVKLEIGNVEAKDVEELCIGLVSLFSPVHKTLRNIKTDCSDSSAPLAVARLFGLTCLELQLINCGKLSYYNAHVLGESSYYAVFEYKEEEHGSMAAKTAAAILETLIVGEQYRSLPEDLKKLKDIIESKKEGPSTTEIMNEAARRNIPIKKVAQGRYVLFGQGKHRKRIEASIADDTGMIAVNIACNKELTKLILKDAMLPVPKGIVITEEEDLDYAVGRLGFPLVTKPLDGHQGKCITTDILKYDELKEGFRIAKEYSEEVIVEKFIKGDDFRFLVVNYKLVAAARRSPALVIGDGRSTIRDLIDTVNKDPLRAKGHNGVLTRIEVDEVTERLLSYNNRTLDSVLEEGVVQVLKDTANLSTGGTAVDVTDEVHPDNISFAERAARIIGLDICGIDIIAPDVSSSFNDNGGAIIEVNAAPGLRMHISPSAGKPRKVGQAIVDMMFPGNSDGRIPIVAITGTNGKTTTARLMAHVAQEQGFCTGFTTTEGIYFNSSQIVKGDCSGPLSTAVILEDPAVEFAVLECARGGIVRSGLAFDQCDIGIVTNVAADHLGLKDIYTVEDMAKVKQVVPRSVKKDGYAILNASVDLVYKMAEGLSCNVALFSLDPENQNIKKHCAQGGIAAVMRPGGNIVIMDAEEEIEVENVENIPVTLKGKAGFMIENVLPVALAAYLLKFSMENVRKALRSFHPNEAQAPGRLNIIEVAGVHVMVDYAHNPHSIKAFSELMKNIKEHKTGIITGVGDRRDEDIIEVGKLAASIYDEIIIRIDDDTRGRKPEEITHLIRRGISQVNPDLPCKEIPNAKEALLQAIHSSKPGSYIVINADNALKTLDIVKKVREELVI